MNTPYLTQANAMNKLAFFPLKQGFDLAQANPAW